MNAGQLIAERLRKGIEEGLYDYKERKHQVTMTFGVSQSSINAENLNIEALIKEANSALYEGKKGGRNQVFVGEF